MKIEFVPGQRNYKISRCEANRDLVLQMEKDGAYLAEIARAIGVRRSRNVEKFLRRNGVTREFPTTQRGEKSHQWKGGVVINKDGYREILSRGHPHAHKHTFYVLEHRLVMEKMIGRYLHPSEVVHHKDGNKLNNSPENLQLFSENSEHLKVDLKGRCPKWSEDGKERIRQAVIQGGVRRRRERSLKASGADAQECR